MVTWNANFEAQPEDTDYANAGANEIRTLKDAISERMELEHDWANVSRPFHLSGRTSVCYVGNTAQIANLANVANGCIAWDTALAAFKVYWANSWTRRDSIPSGTKMFFNANAAPTGWTLVANHDDRVLIVTDTANEGGNEAGTWDLSANISLTCTSNGSHTHGYTTATAGSGGAWAINSIVANGNHDHTVELDTDANTWRPAYLKVLCCSKD